jgi:hypothetical protein
VLIEQCRNPFIELSRNGPYLQLSHLISNSVIKIRILRKKYNNRITLTRGGVTWNRGL